MNERMLKIKLQAFNLIKLSEHENNKTYRNKERLSILKASYSSVLDNRSDGQIFCKISEIFA